tara:strand:- start:54 stop:314 length:261 start_codon:yes stop_codon:yes gene_type:complete
MSRYCFAASQLKVNGSSRSTKLNIMENNKKKDNSKLIQGKHITISDIAKKLLESADLTNTPDELVSELKKIAESDYPEGPAENKQL